MPQVSLAVRGWSAGPCGGQAPEQGPGGVWRYVCSQQDRQAAGGALHTLVRNLHTMYAPSTHLHLADGGPLFFACTGGCTRQRRAGPQCGASQLGSLCRECWLHPSGNPSWEAAQQPLCLFNQRANAAAVSSALPLLKLQHRGPRARSHAIQIAAGSSPCAKEHCCPKGMMQWRLRMHAPC